MSAFPIRLVKSQGFANYLASLKFAFYVMTHPLDGFWDLTREKRGTMAAAHTFVIFTVIIEIMRLMLSSFQFVIVQMEYFNVMLVIAQILLPVALWTVANWSLTTLMDGKGRLSEIYMGVGYAMLPYALINAALIPLSHLITAQEGAIYWALTTFAVISLVFLLICAMMQIHDYSLSKTLGSSLLTLVAIGVMIFIFVMFFSVVSDAIAYFISVFREVWFRML